MGIFVSTADLKKRCRLSKAADDETLAILEEAERETASWMVGVLGQARFTALQAYPSVYPPTTAEHVSRINAEQAETMYIYAVLLYRLPSFFLAAQSRSRMAYNDNAPSRKNSDDLTEQIELYTSKANTLIASLIVEEVVEDDAEETYDRSTSLIGPEKPNTYNLFNSIGREIEEDMFW